MGNRVVELTAGQVELDQDRWQQLRNIFHAE
jgi:hypothetical protein